MNKAKGLEEAVNMNSRFWDDSEESQAVNRPKRHSAASSSCGLVRWYPPLLTISTIMAGVFCWLYVTKPVMVTQTVIPAGTGERASLLVSEGPDQNGDVVVRVSEVSSVPTLNPELSLLPGEEMTSAAKFDRQIPGQEIQPVRINRSVKSLFEPLEEEQIEVGLAEVSEQQEAESNDPLAVEKDSEEDAIESHSGSDSEKIEASAEILPTDASLDLQLRSGGATHKIAISLMGELIADLEQGEAVIAASIED